METVGVAVVSVTLEALATSDVGDSADMSVSAGSTIGVATGGAATGGAATGAREASMELSLTRLEDRVPQPPMPKPRTATTTTTGHTPELERTVSPLSLGQVNVLERTRLSLFA